MGKPGEPQSPMDPVPVETKWSDDVASWVPTALARGGQLHDPDVLPQLVTHELARDKDSSGLIGEIIADAEAPPLVAHEGAVTINPDVQNLLVALSARASEISMKLLEDAPVLQCEVKAPRDWLRGPAGTWQAYDAPTGEWVLPSQLSEAQRRWALLSIWTTMMETGAELDDSHIGCVVIDEPEAALHPRAQRHAVAGLKTLAGELACPIMVATHSPVLLNDPDIRLLHVLRGQTGSTTVNPMEELARSNLDQLGLSMADLLQVQRVFLLVEGEHDAVVLDELIGDELARCRAAVFPLRGAHKAVSALDSRILLEFTDARLLFVLDNMANRRLGAKWRRARALAAAGDREAAWRALGRQTEWKSIEARAAYEVMAAAITGGVAHRVALFGMSKVDVVEYLDVAQFVPGASSWQELAAEWMLFRKAGGTRDFKSWLRHHKGAQVTTAHVRAVARSSDEVPRDFQKLLTTACEHAGSK